MYAYIYMYIFFVEMTPASFAPTILGSLKMKQASIVFKESSPGVVFLLIETFCKWQKCIRLVYEKGNLLTCVTGKGKNKAREGGIQMPSGLCLHLSLHLICVSFFMWLYLSLCGFGNASLAYILTVRRPECQEHCTLWDKAPQEAQNSSWVYS